MSFLSVELSNHILGRALGQFGRVRALAAEQEEQEGKGPQRPPCGRAAVHDHVIVVPGGVDAWKAPLRRGGKVLSLPQGCQNGLTLDTTRDVETIVNVYNTTQRCSVTRAPTNCSDRLVRQRLCGTPPRPESRYSSPIRLLLLLWRRRRRGGSVGIGRRGSSISLWWILAWHHVLAIWPAALLLRRPRIHANGRAIPASLLLRRPGMLLRRSRVHASRWVAVGCWRHTVCCRWGHAPARGSTWGHRHLMRVRLRGPILREASCA